ncbi:MAG: hypothetical protein ABWZ53_07490 [Actinomycetota bacterium]
MLTVAAILLVAGPAHAGSGVRHIDADDSSSALDVHVSRFVVNHETRRAVVRLRMFEVFDIVKGSVWVYFDSRGGTAWDVKARVFQGHLSSRCWLLNRHRRLDGCIWGLPLPRVIMKFPSRILRRDKPVRWWVATTSDGLLLDRAPDFGSYTA